MTKLREIIVGTTETSKEIGNLERNGLVRKIAPRIYTSNLTDPPEKIIRRNWFHLVSDLFPDAQLSHRSALDHVPTQNGHLYLTRSKRGVVELPGLTLHFISGPAPREDDSMFFGNLRISSLERAYLENLQRTKNTGEEAKALTREELEGKIESFIRVKGEEALNQIRDKAKAIAPGLGMEKEAEELNRLVSAMLGTGLSKNLVSSVAKSRVLGEPVDPDRIDLFESLYHELIKKDYPDYRDENRTTDAYQNFAFFEGYFSNYIEGTEFTVKEAKEIITTEMPIPARDEDSHDILGTYQIVSNRKEMAITPTSADHFLTLLQERHAILLSARTSKNPGEFKDKNNRAGNTEFVDKELVRGTLKKGYDWYSILRHPFAKAAYMMFLVSEVHPFLDGNGRIARVMMNAELSSQNLAKIIIPTVYREDYMGAIKKLTRLREADAYIRMLQKAWKFSSQVHQQQFDQMEKFLTQRNAFLAHKEGYLKVDEESQKY
ncbi:MAG: Fic family protein [Bacteroidota bacterium]